MSDLKSCPFCGGVAKLISACYIYYSPYWCECTQCGAEGPVKSSGLEAEKGWNKRAQEQEPVKPKLVGENTWTCGKCDTLLGWEDYAQSGVKLVEYKFCPKCGRKVNWE